MPGTDDRSLSRSDKTHKGSSSLSLPSVDTFKANLNPNLAKKSSILSNRTMGEDLTENEDFSSYKKAFVFWNLDDYPIPSGLDPASIYRNIKSAVYQMGSFDGHLIIACGGGGEARRIKSALKEAPFLYLNPSKSPLAEISSTGWGMPFSILCLARVDGPMHKTIVVIAKQKPESELHRVLQSLKSKKFTVLIVEPSPQDALFHSVESLVGCTQVFRGGDPKRPTPVENPVDVISYHKIEDFSKPITHAEGATAGVFWDVNDCPFPCIDPDLIYKKIESALIPIGRKVKVSIWAYVDGKKLPWGDYLGKKTWEASIYFLPRGDQPSLRMLHDIFLWKMDFHRERYDPTYLIVVSDSVRCGTVLNRTLRDPFHFDAMSVFVVQPTEYVSPETGETTDEWPESLFAHGKHIPELSDSDSESEQHNPKKLRADAEGSNDQA